jgi:hypothetical protein
MNKRQYERYIVEFAARVAGDFEGTRIVYNLGVGGCKIVTDEPLPVRARVAFSFNTPRQAPCVTVRMATVRRILQYEFGIEFLGMQELQRGRLAQYLPNLAAAAA